MTDPPSRTGDERSPEAGPFHHLEPMTPPMPDASVRLEERFLAFHSANPHVFEALRRMALRLKAKGIDRYGMKGLFEVLRWEYAIREGSVYRLDNNFTAYYARHVMAAEPRLAGFFTTRVLAVDRQRPTTAG